MKALKYFFLSIVLLSCASYAKANAWPPQSQATLDTMQMRMSVIKGLPDSVVKNNLTIFADMIDEDEYDLYIINDYVAGVTVSSSLSGSDPASRGKAKGFAKIVLYNDKGEAVKSISTSQRGQGFLNLKELDLPDGIYRLRVDYGNKHTKNGTKPKERIALRVYPSSSASAGRPFFGGR